MPYAATVMNAIGSADPTNPCIRKVPYTGIQFVDIPEFEKIGTIVGELIAGAIPGESDIGPALQQSQSNVRRILKSGEISTPSPTPTSTPDPQLVPVLFATNRQRKIDGSASANLADFSSERSQNLTFGKAVVRVPERHKKGKIEKDRLIWLEGTPVPAPEDPTLELAKGSRGKRRW
jgi:hypothetical protein